MREKKNKFKPMISRIKLNPEQAVLACSCYSAGRKGSYVQFEDAYACCDYTGCWSRGYGWIPVTRTFAHHGTSSGSSAAS